MSTQCVAWLTGISGAGKSTIASIVHEKLTTLGLQSCVLDGDNIRNGLCRDLGFSDSDRAENIRRVAEVANLMIDAGVLPIVALISPLRANRRMARSIITKVPFIEIFVDTPLVQAEMRDPKGLYQKARRGEIKNFAGLDSPYEAPDQPEIHLETLRLSPEAAANVIVERIATHGAQ